MTTIKKVIRMPQLIVYTFLALSCSSENVSEIILNASTPGDSIVKAMLAIPVETKVDFIQWKLSLGNKNTFVLDIVYGESKPNTLGFKSEVKKTIKGTYRIARNQGNNRFREIYQLCSNDLPGIISVVKITENLFHILTSQSTLMVGNGGWSYSLNRKITCDAGETLIASPMSEDKSLHLTFEGRTPCREIAFMHPGMNASSSCFKLKWKLILNRDSLTNLPTTCTIHTVVNNQPRNITGIWTIINGTATNPKTVIYEIQADHFAEPVLLLLGDDNVLFFLDRDNNPLIGNENFSYTLNKRVQ